MHMRSPRPTTVPILCAAAARSLYRKKRPPREKEVEEGTTAGRVLLLACRTAWSMEEFNEILLALPLDIQAAQHLEGSATARLWLAHPELEGWIGGAHGGPVLPNVLGATPKAAP